MIGRRNKQSHSLGFLLAFLWLTSLSSCAENTKLKVIRTSLISVDAARVGMETFDRAYQLSLIDKAKTRDEALAAIQAYRDKRAVLIEAFTLTYKALAAAALDPTDLNYLDALRQANEIIEAVKRFKAALAGGPKPEPPKVDLGASP
jgi:hypothetical protein